MAAQALAFSGATTIVTLKDGSEIAEPVFATTMRAIQDIARESFFIFSDLVEKCRDPNFKFERHPFGDSKKTLQKYALIDKNESVYGAVKAIVLNATVGSKLSLKLVDPILRA